MTTFNQTLSEYFVCPDAYTIPAGWLPADAKCDDHHAAVSLHKATNKDLKLIFVARLQANATPSPLEAAIDQGRNWIFDQNPHVIEPHERYFAGTLVPTWLHLPDFKAWTENINCQRVLFAKSFDDRCTGLCTLSITFKPRLDLSRIEHAVYIAPNEHFTANISEITRYFASLPYELYVCHDIDRFLD